MLMQLQVKLKKKNRRKNVSRVRKTRSKVVHNIFTGLEVIKKVRFMF